MGIRIKVEVTTPDGCRASWTFSDSEDNTSEEALAEALGHALPALGYCLVPSNEDDTALAFLAGAQIAGRVVVAGEVAP